MLHLFRRSSGTIFSTAGKPICFKPTYHCSALNGPGFRALQRQRIQQRFSHRDASKRVPEARKPNPKPPVAERAEKLPTTQQISLLHRLKAQGQLSQDQFPRNLSRFQRLFSPFVFTVAVCGGSYLFATNWKPPPLDSRLFPTLPQSFTTVAAIIAVNCAVYLAWKVPLPISWRFLNRFFVSSPALPYSLGILGNTFSHQSTIHLGFNMFCLYVFGTSLCDQIGRGNFLGLYFSAGVVSSFASLTHNVLRARFHIYALGASGAITGVVGAFTYFNPDRELYFMLLPFIAFQAKYFISGVALLELFGIARGWQRLDHVAHLSGLLWGAGAAYLLEQRARRRVRRMRRIQQQQGGTAPK